MRRRRWVVPWMFTTAAPCTPSLPPPAAEAAPLAAPHRARSPAPGIEPAPAPPLRANPPDPSAPPSPSAATAPAVPRHRSGSAPPAGGPGFSARAGIALIGQAVCRASARSGSGMRTEVDCTEASKRVTPRSADIRKGVGYPRTQRGVCEYGIVPAERESSAAAAALSALILRGTTIADAVCCSAWFGPHGCTTGCVRPA